MNREPEDVPNDADFFLIFRVLRESRALLSQGFARRVRSRLQKLVDEERLTHPSFLTILNQLGMDTINLVSEGISGRPSIRETTTTSLSEDNE